MRKLTPRQERFVIEYAKDFNATQAALRAGYKGKYVRNTAMQLLGKTKDIIEERKAAVLAERKANGIATLEQTLKLATAMAFHDPRKLFDPHGNCKDMPDLSRIQGMTVAGFEVEESFEGKGAFRKSVGYIKKFKLLDRTPYVTMLMKFHHAFPGEQPKSSESHGTLFPLEAFSHLSLEDQVNMRQRLLTVLQDYTQPKVVNG